MDILYWKYIEKKDKHKRNSEWDILDLDILYNKKYLGNR